MNYNWVQIQGSFGKNRENVVAQDWVRVWKQSHDSTMGWVQAIVETQS